MTSQVQSLIGYSIKIILFILLVIGLPSLASNFTVGDFKPGKPTRAGSVQTAVVGNTSGTLINVASGSGIIKGVAIEFVGTSNGTVSTDGTGLLINFTSTIDGVSSAAAMPVQPAQWLSGEGSVTKHAWVFLPLNDVYKSSASLTWSSVEVGELSNSYQAVLRPIYTPN